MATKVNIQATLKARGKTHGDFTDNANIAQQIKEALKSGPNWPELDSVKKEALEVIASKMARIVSGNADEPDHFHDIAGYATLAEERMAG